MRLAPEQDIAIDVAIAGKPLGTVSARRRTSGMWQEVSIRLPRIHQGPLELVLTNTTTAWTLYHLWIVSDGR